MHLQHLHISQAYASSAPHQPHTPCVTDYTSSCTVLICPWRSCVVTNACLSQCKSYGRCVRSGPCTACMTEDEFCAGCAAPFGIEGWRFSFLSVAVVSAGIGVFTYLFGEDPRSQRRQDPNQTLDTLGMLDWILPVINGLEVEARLLALLVCDDANCHVTSPCAHMMLESQEKWVLRRHHAHTRHHSLTPQVL